MTLIEIKSGSVINDFTFSAWIAPDRFTEDKSVCGVS